MMEKDLRDLQDAFMREGTKTDDPQASALWAIAIALLQVADVGRALCEAAGMVAGSIERRDDP
jgi:hypothetical protein